MKIALATAPLHSGKPFSEAATGTATATELATIIATATSRTTSNPKYLVNYVGGTKKLPC